MANGNGKYKKEASVTIHYDAGSGDVTVSEDPIYIQDSGTIDWRCDDADWTVTVEDTDDPFDQGKVVNGQAGQKKVVNVKRNASQGQSGRTYKYTVEVRDGDTPIRLDPEIEVGPVTGP
jgi:hypothetical protein